MRPRLTVVQPVAASAARSRQVRVGSRPRTTVAQRHVEVVQERRAAQAQRFALVKRLQASGQTGQAIMRETGISRGPLRKWLPASELPPRKRMAPRPGMPDFYEEQLRRRWTEGCQDGRRLMAEIQALGFVGCYSGLARLLAPWRDPVQAPLEITTDSAVNTADRPAASNDAPASVCVRHVSPRRAAALLSQPRPLLTARQAEIVDGLKERCPGFTTMRRLVLSFRTILRVGKVETLHRWLARAQTTSIRPLQRFVKTLRRDIEAVQGAITEPWSNGPVEGHINRLKTLRRQMYGRAGVDLLRARLLPLPPFAHG
ncbi:MAG: transposase [Acidobacteriota bacterium]